MFLEQLIRDNKDDVAVIVVVGNIVILVYTTYSKLEEDIFGE